MAYDDRKGIPPKWKTDTAQEEYLRSAIGDPDAAVCGMCGSAKLLIFNPTKDRYSDVKACPQCDGVST